MVVSDIDMENGNKVMEEIKSAGGETIFVKADTSSPEDKENLVKETVKQFGKLDIAVNNAGIGGEINKVAEMSLEGWKKIIDINLSRCILWNEVPNSRNGKERQRKHYQYCFDSWTGRFRNFLRLCCCKTRCCGAYKVCSMEICSG